LYLINLMKIINTLLLLGLSYVAQSQVIYLTNNKYEADYICTIASNKYEADWLIHVNDWERFSRQNHGNWFITENKYKAQFKIHLSSGYYGGGDKVRKIYFVCDKYQATLNDKY